MFETSSGRRRIGEHSFHRCRLNPIAILASVEEVDGSQSLNCLLKEIRVAGEIRNFSVQGTLLATADGTEITRYFGIEQDVVVPMTIDSLSAREIFFRIVYKY
jgi:hypothetical protein